MIDGRGSKSTKKNPNFFPEKEFSFGEKMDANRSWEAILDTLIIFFGGQEESFPFKI